jgi:hypothetical protein
MSVLNQTEAVLIEEIARESLPTLIKAVSHQSKSGWEQWLYGRISQL